MAALLAVRSGCGGRRLRCNGEQVEAAFSLRCGPDAACDTDKVGDRDVADGAAEGGGVHADAKGDCAVVVFVGDEGAGSVDAVVVAVLALGLTVTDGDFDKLAVLGAAFVADHPEVDEPRELGRQRHPQRNWTEPG